MGCQKKNSFARQNPCRPAQRVQLPKQPHCVWKFTSTERGRVCVREIHQKHQKEVLKDSLTIVLWRWIVSYRVYMQAFHKFPKYAELEQDGSSRREKCLFNTLRLLHEYLKGLGWKNINIISKAPRPWLNLMLLSHLLTPANHSNISENKACTQAKCEPVLLARGAVEWVYRLVLATLPHSFSLNQVHLT